QLERTLKEIEKLPRGSIRIKKINGRDYPYLQYKEHRKVKSVAIKKNDDIQAIEFKIKKRKQLKNKIRLMKREIKEIETSLKRLNV
ncbi:MAG: hypothetical protein KAH05_07810, partial [Clostridiales bacterium]|nr:hypothetical protein [Clostridiales bacterium]